MFGRSSSFIYSIWNFANAHTLVIVTANVSPGTSSPAGGQLDRIDVEIVDGSHKGNVYLAKKVRVRDKSGHNFLSSPMPLIVL